MPDFDVHCFRIQTLSTAKNDMVNSPISEKFKYEHTKNLNPKTQTKLEVGTCITVLN